MFANNLLCKTSRLFNLHRAGLALKATTTSRIPLITCKRKEFNLYLDNFKESDAEFGSIKLASDGWRHNKSKGDFFILQPNGSGKVSTSAGDEKSLDSLGVVRPLVENVEAQHKGFVSTYIQQLAIPHLLRGDHTLIAAETGCGKTYCYLLPILQSILERKAAASDNRNFNSPLALILTPGRELASQIGQVAQAIGQSLNINVQCVLGGRTKLKIMNPSFNDVDVLIGSFGAVSKLVTTGIYRTDHVQHVVLDEADTMLDDSFNDKLGYFLSKFPFHKNVSKRLREPGPQLILVAATMPTNIEELLQQIIDTRTLEHVVSPDLHKLMRHIPQKFVRINKSERPAFLLELAKSETRKNRPLIIFGNKSATSDYISIFLNDNGVDAINLNGDMQMHFRVGRFEKFQDGLVNVLATTDVASRGLDTTRVKHILNFDFPLHAADYIHRCGRAGRMGSATDCYVTNVVSSQREIELVQKIEHAARTNGLLQNVNANITNIIRRQIMKDLAREQQAANN